MANSLKQIKATHPSLGQPDVFLQGKLHTIPWLVPAVGVFLVCNVCSASQHLCGVFIVLGILLGVHITPLVWLHAVKCRPIIRIESCCLEKGGEETKAILS